jgi:ABC-type Fe3+ transport system permease subunit
MQCEEEPTPPPPNPQRSDLGGWLLLAVLAAVVIIDVWLLRTKRPTMSQWVKRKTRGKLWWKAFGMGVIGLLLVHLFFGGPL